MPKKYAQCKRAAATGIASHRVCAKILELVVGRSTTTNSLDWDGILVTKEPLHQRALPGLLDFRPISSARTLSIAWSPLIEHTSDQVDLPALQFLRGAIGNFPVHPHRECLDVLLALRERSEFRHTSSCMFAPDSVITR